MSLRASKTVVILKKLIELKAKTVNKTNSNGIYKLSGSGGRTLTHIMVPIGMFDEIEIAHGNARTYVDKYLDMKNKTG